MEHLQSDSRSERESASHQEVLFHTYIQPHIAHITQVILAARRGFDRVMEEERREDFFQDPDRELHHRGLQDIQRYPTGFCKEIRNHISKILQSDRVIQDFIARGGHYKNRWMSYHGDSGDRAFANTIQIGNHLFDTAYEEFNSSGIPLQIVEENDNRYKTVDIYEYQEIAEIYWGHRIFSSVRVLGSLAPFFPVIKVDTLGRIDIPIISEEELSRITQSQGMSSLEWLSGLTQVQSDPGDAVIQGIKDVIQMYIVGSLTGGYDLDFNTYTHLSEEEFRETIHQIYSQIPEASEIPNRLDFIKKNPVGKDLTPEEIQDIILAFHQTVLKRFTKLYNRLMLSGALSKA